MNKIINTNTVWKAHSTQNGKKLLIANNATLIVEEGVSVNFDEITLQGNMQCNGTQHDPIIINSPINAESGTLTTANFTHFNQDLQVKNTKATNCVFTKFCSFFGNSVSVSHCHFNNIDTVYFQASQNTIFGNTFTNMVRIQLQNNCHFYANTLKGFYTFLTTKSTLNDISELHSNLGLSVRQSGFSFIFIENNNFENMQAAITITRRRISQRLRLLNIENNNFINNKVDINLYENNLVTTICNNNFLNTDNKNFVSNAKNSNFDKTISEKFSIGSNFYNNNAPTFYDHTTDFEANYTFQFNAPLLSKIDTKNATIDLQYFKTKKRNFIISQIPNMLLKICINWMIWFAFFGLFTLFTDALVKSILLPLFALISLMFSIILPINMLQEIKNWFSKSK